jgi:tetratricopeptide (TPR) repeat protein
MPHRVLLPVLLIAALPSGGPARAHDGAHGEIERTTRTLAAHPSDFDALLRRAEFRRICGDFAGAAADLAAARTLSPEGTGLDLCAAALAFDGGAHAEAQAAVARHLARHPADAKALRLRARIRRAAGDLAGAAGDLDRVLAAGGGTPDDYLTRAAVQRAAGFEPAAVLAGLDEGIARLGAVVGLALPAIEIEQALGRHDAALARLDRLAATPGLREPLLELRAAVLARAGRAREARAVYAAALAEIESLPPARRQLPAVREREARIRSALSVPAAPGSHRPAPGTGGAP